MLELFSALYDITKSSLAKINAPAIAVDEDAGNESDAKGEVPNDLLNIHVQITCKFKTKYYCMHNGRKTTPLQTMAGQTIYGKPCPKKLTTLNKESHWNFY